MKRVLIVDDDKDNIELLSQYLAREGHIIQSANDGEGALHRLKAWKPHLVLLDINLPGASGIELIPRIRAASGDDYVSIILVSANITLDDVTAGLDAGADDYLTKPFRAQDLITRLRTMLRFKDAQDALRRANHRIEELQTTDELTGLMSMRVLNRKMDDEIQRSKRFRKPASAIALNLDGFSAVNHEHGFAFGNLVIQEAARRIKQSLRSIDLVARVGADEFVVLLVETDLANAEFMAERLKDTFKAAPFKEGKDSVEISAGMGIASINYNLPEQSAGDLLKNCTEALKAAKKAGKGQIELYSFA